MAYFSSKNKKYTRKLTPTNSGVYIDFKDSLLEELPEDMQNLIREHSAALTIQGPAKKMNAKRSLIDALKVRGYSRYIKHGRDRGNIKFIKKLWTNLDPENQFTASWFKRFAKIIKKNDFDFKTRNFWWKVMEDNLAVMNEMTEDGTEDPSEYLDEPNRTYYIDTLKASVKIMNTAGYNTSYDSTDSLDWARDALNWWQTKRTNDVNSGVARGKLKSRKISKCRYGIKKNKTCKKKTGPKRKSKSRKKFRKRR